MISCITPRLPYAFGCWTCVLGSGALGSIGVYFVNQAAGILGIAGFGITACCLGAATCVARDYSARLADTREIQSYAAVNEDLKEDTGRVELVVSKLTPSLQALGTLVAQLKADNILLRKELQTFEEQKRASAVEKAALEQERAKEKEISVSMHQTTEELQSVNSERKTAFDTETQQLIEVRAENTELKASNAQLQSKAETLAAQVKRIELLAGKWREEREKIGTLVTQFSQDEEALASLQDTLTQSLSAHDASWEAEIREFKSLLAEEEAATLQQRIDFKERVISPLQTEIAALTQVSNALHEREERVAKQNQNLEKLRAQELDLQADAASQLAEGEKLLHPPSTLNV